MVTLFILNSIPPLSLAAQIVMKYSVNSGYNSSKAIPGINNKRTHLLVADVQVSVICFTQVGISFFQVHDIVVSPIFVSTAIFISNFLLSHYHSSVTTVVNFDQIIFILVKTLCISTFLYL